MKLQMWRRKQKLFALSKEKRDLPCVKRHVPLDKTLFQSTKPYSFLETSWQEGFTFIPQFYNVRWSKSREGWEIFHVGMAQLLAAHPSEKPVQCQWNINCIYPARAARSKGRCPASRPSHIHPAHGWPPPKAADPVHLALVLGHDLFWD